MDTTAITFPTDPDLSDVRTMVLGAVQAGRGDRFTAAALAARFGLSTDSVHAVLLSLEANRLVIADEDGYASALTLG
jgi:DNA-binding GntR family transcriptional regulator